MTSDYGKDRPEDIDDPFAPRSRGTSGPREYDSTPNYARERLRTFARIVPNVESSSREEAERKSRSLRRMAMLVFIAVAVTGLGYWHFVHVPLSVPGTPPPFIFAEDGPVRVKPEDAGGMNIPHQDKLVYGRIDPEGAPRESLERLLPPPVSEDVVPSESRPVESGLEPRAGRQTSDLSEGSAPQSRVATAPPSRTAQVRETQAKKTQVQNTQPPPTTPDKGKTRTQGAGNFRVQLGAFRNTEAAEAEWTAVSKKFPEILAGLTHQIMRVDLGARGIYYRLQAGSVEKKAARAICQNLKAKNQGCLIVQP